MNTKKHTSPKWRTNKWRTKQQNTDTKKRSVQPRSKIGKYIYRMRNKAFETDKDGNFTHNHYLFVCLRYAFIHERKLRYTTNVTALIYLFSI